MPVQFQIGEFPPPDVRGREANVAYAIARPSGDGTARPAGSSLRSSTRFRFPSGEMTIRPSAVKKASRELSANQGLQFGWTQFQPGSGCTTAVSNAANSVQLFSRKS